MEKKLTLKTNFVFFSSPKIVLNEVEKKIGKFFFIKKVVPPPILLLYELTW